MDYNVETLIALCGEMKSESINNEKKTRQSFSLYNVF